MSREWERALERQLALIEYTDSGHASLWMDLFVRMYKDMMAPETLRQRVAGLLRKADTFYVSAEMTKLSLHAAESVGAPVLEPHIPFTKTGFAYFQEPWRIDSAIEVGDEEGDLVPHHLLVRAVLWTWEPRSVITIEQGGDRSEVPKDGVTFFLFGSDSQLDLYQDWLEDTSVPIPEHLMQQGVDVESWRATVEALRHHFGIDGGYHQAPGGLNVVEAQSWSGGQVWDEIRHEGLEALFENAKARGAASWMELEYAGKVWFSVAKLRRVMYSLWSIMAQPIAAPRTEQANRDYRRRWERTVGETPNYGDVRVVTLRRSMSGGGPLETDEEYGREWSHRWLVRGFWRNQWYPSEGVHRLIWIDPFIKGPQDKPLIIKDSVYQVVR